MWLRRRRVAHVLRGVLSDEEAKFPLDDVASLASENVDGFQGPFAERAFAVESVGEEHPFVARVGRTEQRVVERGVDDVDSAAWGLQAETDVAEPRVLDPQA